MLGGTVGGGGQKTYNFVTHQTAYNPNKVTDNFGTVGGGRDNIAGNDSGDLNDASYATVGGGSTNTASGTYATVPGGFANTASGTYSLAAGSRARSLHQGSFVWSDSTTSFFDSTAANQFLIRASGGVGIGTANPQAALDVAPLPSGVAARFGGRVGIGTSSPTHLLTAQSSDTETVRLVGPGGYGSQGKLNFGHGNYVYIQEDIDDRLRLYGRLGVLVGSSVDTALTSQCDVAFKSGVYGTNSQNGGTGVEGRNTATGSWGYLGGTYGVYGETGGGSTFAAGFKGNVRIMSATTGATVVELGEGLDYAEGFDVSDKESAEPGAVLVIDAKNPGRLAVSTKPYDRKVAGIVAGANDLKSGVRLGVGFDHKVALAGRVYCNADATKVAIEPGDLLTTSSRKGYAMKVTDHARAQGAILGKAMQGLAKGKTGRILVLVTLQ